MPNISINLIKSKDRIEESNIRSSLLFNHSKQRKTRDDLMDKTILSVIIGSENPCDEKFILGSFKQRFGIALDATRVKTSISNLLKLNLISEDNGYYSTKEKAEAEFSNQINQETSWLIGSIIQRVRSMKGVTITDESKAIENIKEALSVYFHMYGYSFFNCQVDATDTQKKEAVSLVTNGLEKRFGQALIIAIADTLSAPSEREKTVLTTWAKAFISAQIMGLDPTLRNFKATAFRAKKFVLDTDVVLNCIASNAKYSSDYRAMMEKLLSAGCRLIVPRKVVEEVKNHANAAINRFKFAGRQIKEYTDDLLESNVANVFIEDYVKTIRLEPHKADMGFNEYIGNIYCSTDDEVLEFNLLKVFNNQIQEGLDVNVDQNELDKLTDEVYTKTIGTEKGAIRSDEENYTISNTDAYLYLAVKQLSKEETSGNILSHNCYLLTRTTRTIKAAKVLGLYQDEIVCNPNILLSVLQETGLIDSDKLNIINLFDNPFLAYSSERIWGDISPILSDKQNIIKYKELQQLRHDFKVDFHNLLTAKNVEEKMNYARDITESGYTFTADLANAQKIINEERQAKEDALKELEETKRKVIELQNRMNTTHVKTATNYKTINNRTKKKRKRK